MSCLLFDGCFSPNNLLTKKEVYILDQQNLRMITNFQNHYLFLMNKI